MNLHQKLIAIRKMVEYVEKDTQSYQYKYVSGTQLLSKIRPKMDELGVLLIPAMVEPDKQGWTETTDSKDKKLFVVSSPMTMTWVDADNPEDKIVIPWFMVGAQNDPSKAGGSGLTFFARYFLLNFFSIPNDDLDPDAFQEKNKPKVKTTTKKELVNILKIATGQGYTKEDVTKHVLDTYAIDNAMELTEDQATNVSDYFKNNPKAAPQATQEPESAQDTPPTNAEAFATKEQEFINEFKSKRKEGFATWVYSNKGRIMESQQIWPDAYNTYMSKWDDIYPETPCPF